MTVRRWIAYTRVSTEDQALQGASLDAQLSACVSFAKAKGWGPVDAVSDPGLSGKSLKRPGAQSILAGAEAGTVAGVIVWRLDRWTRSLRDLIDSIAAMEKVGAAFVSVTESIDTSGPMGRFTLHLMGALAQLERETISQRVKMGMHKRAADGKFAGGRIPAGLMVNKERVLVPDPKTCAAVGDCWRIIREGGSLLDCGRHLEAAGVPGQWEKSRISWMLRSQRYRGILVTGAEQDQALASLGMRPSPGNRRAGRMVSAKPQPSDRIWRLHGLAVCRRCGAGLAGSHSTGNGGPMPYLRCTGRMRGNGCDAPNLPAQAYEDRVVLEVSRVLSDGPGFVERIRLTADHLAKQAGPAADDRLRLCGERDHAQAILDRALTLALRGGPTARAVEGRVGEIQEQIESLNARIAQADGVIAAAGSAGLDVEASAAAVAEYAGNLGKLSPEAQTVALRQLVRLVRLDVDGLEVVISPSSAPIMVRMDRPDKLSEDDAIRTIWTHSAEIKRRRGYRGRWELLG